MLDHSPKCREVHSIVDAAELAGEEVAARVYHFIPEVVGPARVEILEGPEEIEEEAVGLRLKSKFSGKSNIF